MSDDYNDHASVLIGDVDCTVSKDLCSSHGVRGYPTVKTFKAGVTDGEKYGGGRDIASLKAHAPSLVAAPAADSEL